MDNNGGTRDEELLLEEGEGIKRQILWEEILNETVGGQWPRSGVHVDDTYER